MALDALLTFFVEQQLPPFIGIDPFTAPHLSTRNAYFSVLLQLGIVGLFAFLAPSDSPRCARGCALRTRVASCICGSPW